MALGPLLPSAPKSLWSPAELRGSHGQERRLGSPKTHVQIPAGSLPVASLTSMNRRPSSGNWDNAHIYSSGLLESERDPARGWHTEPDSHARAEDVRAGGRLGQRRCKGWRPGEFSCSGLSYHLEPRPLPRPGLAPRPLDGVEDRTLCGAAKGTTPCLFPARNTVVSLLDRLSW